MDYTQQAENNNVLANQNSERLIKHFMDEYRITFNEVYIYMQKLKTVKENGWGVVHVTVRNGKTEMVEGVSTTRIPVDEETAIVIQKKV